MSPIPPSLLAPAQWQTHFSIGITGHRAGHAIFAENQQIIRDQLGKLFGAIAAIQGELTEDAPTIRQHNLLAGGADQIAAELALERGWDLIAPLPFGLGLNLAINALAKTPGDVAALCAGRHANDPEVEARAAHIRSVLASAAVFEIADRDEEIRGLLEASLTDPDNLQNLRAFDALCSENAVLAGRVMIERSDLLIAVWDGHASHMQGGTGHTVVTALQQGTPVLIMEPAAPETWSIHTRPEELGHFTRRGGTVPDIARLRATIEATIVRKASDLAAIKREKWHAKRGFGLGFYRLIETLFGGREPNSGASTADYEAPDAIAEGSAASLLKKTGDALGNNSPLQSQLAGTLLPMFAWADGISSRLSDAYRSGMSLNFLLSALAIIAGVAYLPFNLASQKWAFASAELLLLVAILGITFTGYRMGWHRRWFETRRVAEYLRFAPGLLLMGVSRPIGRWPKGGTLQWPEQYARDALRNAGLPAVTLDRAYIRTILESVVLAHVKAQRVYHEAKAKRLTRVHHRLDKSAEACFLAAVLSVSVYLLLELGAVFDLFPASVVFASAKTFTFLGVTFPTLGANLAGIRYFGDFERFAAISNVTSAKLGNVASRIELLLSGAADQLTYGTASNLVREVDEIVVDEIAAWQAVFGAKHLSLPA
jgi:hypothetical protein